MKYDEFMDKECIELCNVLNSLTGVRIFESCCGHLKNRYSVWFFCENINTISRLGRTVERNYSDGKWEVVVDSTDTHPVGIFWLRSIEPFTSQEEMETSLQRLIANIKKWFSLQYDEYFNTPAGVDKAPKKDYRKLYEEVVNSDWYKQAYVGKSLGDVISIEGLDEAAEKAAREVYPYEGGTKGLVCENSIPIFKRGFKAGAEWRDAQIPKLPEGLDKAAEEWVRAIMRKPVKAHEFLYTYLLDTFRAGAEWMAGQGETIETVAYFASNIGETEICENPKSVRPGDKVIIQIRKKN